MYILANLNIIGNGFDLYHGLPTSYYYFACYLVSKREDIYDDWAKMYGFHSGIYHHFTEDFDRQIDDVGYWRNFENNLAFLSSDWVEDSLPDDLNLENSDAVQLTVDAPDHVEELLELLDDWIKETVDTDNNFKIVDEMLGENRLTFDPADAFITFNYTHTLEKIYMLRNVLHIHGESGCGYSPTPLIIGHGHDDVINKMHTTIEELNPYWFEQGANNRITEYNFEIEILTRLKKPVDRCLPILQNFIHNFGHPDAICAYGFSFGDVDMPYMKLIRETWPDCPWRFSYRSDYSKDTLAKTASSLGLNLSQYEMFQFKNAQSKNILNRLVKENGITEYPKF